MTARNKGQAVIDQLKAKVNSLEAENNDLKLENKRLGGGIGPGMKPCGQCGQPAPDNSAFFGSAANDPDQSKCASCSRTSLHDLGVRHFTAGCRHCAVDGVSGGVFEGVVLAWMHDANR